MTSSDLKPEQTAALIQALARQGKDLSRLVWRMERLHWPKDDLVYSRVLRARDAVLAAMEAVQQAQVQNAKPAWMRAMGS